jgi:hypothetical protein
MYTYLYEYVLNLFENMHTARQPHNATLPDSRTLPHALSDSCTLPRTLLRTPPHCWTQLCALLHTATHCMNANAAHRTQDTAQRTQSHTTINMDSNSRTLPHNQTQQCALPQTAAHCMKLKAAHPAPHTAHCTQLPTKFM